MWGFTVRGTWRPNITEIFWLQLMPSRCVFLVLLMLGSTLLGAGFLYCILSASSLDPNSSGPQGPLRPGGSFPTTPRLQLATTQLAWLLSWLSYILFQRPLDRPRDLWNRMFNRHQAEITVMQFRGHSLPVSVYESIMGFFYLPRPI